MREVEPGESSKQKQQKAPEGKKDEQRTTNEQEKTNEQKKQNCVKTSIAVAAAKRVCR